LPTSTRAAGTYGMLRIRATLRIEHDMIVNRKLILSIMRELKIQGLPGPRRKKKNLVNVATEEDLVQRNFSAERPDALWLTDITEHPTREGKVYCCVVLDLFTRKVVGWAIDRRCETVLVNDALAMANGSRRSTTSTIIHSDHGSQFTSWGFTENVRNYGLMGSVGSKGDSYDCELNGAAA
jgi:putative transposase